MKKNVINRATRTQIFSQILDCALAPDSRVILGDWEKKDIRINTPLRKIFDPISLHYLLNKIEKCFQVKIDDQEVFRSAHAGGLLSPLQFLIIDEKDSGSYLSFKTFLGLTNLVGKKLNCS